MRRLMSMLISSTVRSHTLLRHGPRLRARAPAWCGVLTLVLAGAGCGHVRAAQRENLASPAMQFEMDPIATGQRDSILEITEGATFPTAGPEPLARGAVAIEAHDRACDGACCDSRGHRRFSERGKRFDNRAGRLAIDSPIDAIGA